MFEMSREKSDGFRGARVLGTDEVDRRTALVPALEGFSTLVGVGSRRRSAETDLVLGLGFALEEERGVTFREELELGLGLGLGFGRSLTGGDGSTDLLGFEAMILPPPPPRSLSLEEIIDKLLGFLGEAGESRREKGKEGFSQGFGREEEIGIDLKFEFGIWFD
jgi:hypothetical protein